MAYNFLYLYKYLHIKYTVNTDAHQYTCQTITNMYQIKCQFHRNSQSHTHKVQQKSILSFNDISIIFLLFLFKDISLYSAIIWVSDLCTNTKRKEKVKMVCKAPWWRLLAEWCYTVRGWQQSNQDITWKYSMLYNMLKIFKLSSLSHTLLAYPTQGPMPNIYRGWAK